MATITADYRLVLSVSVPDSQRFTIGEGDDAVNVTHIDLEATGDGAIRVVYQEGDRATNRDDTHDMPAKIRAQVKAKFVSIAETISGRQ